MIVSAGVLGYATIKLGRLPCECWLVHANCLQSNRVRVVDLQAVVNLQSHVQQRKAFADCDASIHAEHVCQPVGVMHRHAGVGWHISCEAR
jgi:hypothetical protein